MPILELEMFTLQAFYTSKVEMLNLICILISENTNDVKPHCHKVGEETSLTYMYKTVVAEEQNDKALMRLRSRIISETYGS